MKDTKNANNRTAAYLPSPRMFWLVAFVFCCFQALMMQKLVLPLIPALHGGHGLLVNDATIFHEAASAVADKIKSVGWSEWSLYPQTSGGSFSGNVAILSVLYVLFGPEPAFFIPLNAGAHATGALMLYLIGPLIWPGRTGRLGGLVAATVFVLFPSSLQWYGQNHKDAFIITGVLTMLYAWLLLISPNPEHSLRVRRPFLLVLGGMSLVLIMKPYLSILLAAAFFFSGLVLWINSLLPKRRDTPSTRDRLKQFAFLGIVFAGAVLGSLLPASELALRQDVSTNQDGGILQWRWKSFVPGGSSFGASSALGGEPHDEIVVACLRGFEAPFRRISELRAHFAAHAKLVGARSGIDEDRMPENAVESALYLPRALVVGLFAPFPSSWAEHVSLLRLAGAGETFIWYILFIGAIALALKCPGKTLLAGLAFCAVILTVYAYTIPNVGNLYRVRFGCWMFVLLCGSIGWLGVLAPFLRRLAAQPLSETRPNYSSVAKELSSRIGGLESLGISGAAALLLTFLGLLGFLARDLLLIHIHGMDKALDIFYSAAILPMVFVGCLAFPLGDVLTKPFLEANGNGEKHRAAEIVRGFLMVGCLAVLPCTALLMAFPGAALGLVLGTYAKQAVTGGETMVRIMAPILLFGVFNIVGNTVLNAWRRSANAAAAQLIVPVCAISAILMVPADQALLAAAIGMLCGAVLNAAAVFWLCGAEGVRLFPRFSREMLSGVDLRSYFWIALAAAFTALAVPVNFHFASLVGAGSVSVWAFAAKLVTLFNGILAVGVTAVVLPHLAVKFMGSDDRGRDHFFFLLVAGTWVGGALALALSIFSEPLVFAVFGGQLSESQMLSLARVLRIGALQVPVALAGAVVFKSIAVSGSSNRAVIASFAGLAVNIIFNQLFVSTLGLQAVAIGALLSIMLTTLIACAGLRARYGTSVRVGGMLLLGWLAWAGVVWAVDASDPWGFGAAFSGLVALAVLHGFFWNRQLHHRSDLRAFVRPSDTLW